MIGHTPEDCAVTPKLELDALTQLSDPEFADARSSRADFAFEAQGLRMWVEAHAPGVFRIRCGSSDALSPEKPSARAKAHAEWLLAREEAVGELSVSSAVSEDYCGWLLAQGDAVLKVLCNPFRLELWLSGELVWQSWSLAQGEGPEGRAWQLGIDLDPDEAVYGLGATPGELDRRGQRLVSDLRDSRALPLAWSPRGWGLYFNTLGRLVHDVACDDEQVYQVQFHGNVLDVFLFAGEPSEIINQYSALTGRAGQPGLWPMGVWLEQTPGQTLDDVLRIAAGLREERYPFDALQLAAPAVYGFQQDKPGFEWNAARIPDVRAAQQKLQALSLQMAAPTFPGVLQGTELFDEWEDRGWLLIDDESGEAHVFAGNDVTGGKPFGLLDLTHKDAYRLWSERQRQAVDEGLGAPVCLAQLDIPDGITARGGETGSVLRTIYPMLARKALFDAVAGHRTPQEGVILSTDLFPAVQRFAWQQGPDVTNDWAGAEHSLRTALALGNSGVPAQIHRLGSAGAPLDGMTPELYVRWLAMSVFSANFSLQATEALLPGSFDEATRELARHWLQWRYRLTPYVLGIIEDAVRTGLPVQRSMAQAFPADPQAHVWDTQYLLGPALLVAPVLQPGEQTRVYLPAGEAWWDLNTGWRYEGGTALNVTAGLDTLPIFGREGHMLCLGPVAQHTGEFNSARLLDEVWMFGMPEHSPVVMRNKIRVMQMQGSSYIKGLEGLRILPSEGLEVKRRGAEVRISRAR